MSNLLKVGTTISKSERIIDYNDIIKDRVEAARAASRQKADSDGFINGLNADVVERLPEDEIDTEAAASEEMTQESAEAARAEAEEILAQAKAQAEEILAQAQAQAQLATQAQAQLPPVRPAPPPRKDPPSAWNPAGGLVGRYPEGGTAPGARWMVCTPLVYHSTSPSLKPPRQWGRADCR